MIFLQAYYFFADCGSESDVNESLLPNQLSESAQQSDMSKLKDVCKVKNWRVVNVPSDGHCLFSSLAIQLGRPQATQEIRRELVDYLRTHPNIVSQSSTP